MSNDHDANVHLNMLQRIYGIKSRSKLNDLVITPF